MKYPGALAAAVILVAALAGCAQFDSLRPVSIDPGVRAATSLLQKGEHERAISQFDAAIRTAPPSFRIYSSIAVACMRNGSYDLAAKYALQGAEALPKGTQDERKDKAALYAVAGDNFDRLADSEKTISCYKSALVLEPDSPIALNGLGYAYAQAGHNLDEAVRLTTRAVILMREKRAAGETKDDSLGMVVDSLGWAYFNQKKYKEAISNLASAAELAPRQVEIQLHLGLAYQAAGQPQDARIALLRAKNLEPNNSNVTRALGEVETVLGVRH